MASNPDVNLEALSTLMQLEASARRARSEKALEFLIVNETKKLVDYQQGILVHHGRKGLQVSSASNIAVVEDQAPFVAWLERVLKKLRLARDNYKIQAIDASMLEEGLADQWSDYALPFALWCPMLAPNKTLLGGLWLMRDKPWQENDITICGRVIETYSHAWGALTQNGALRPRKNRRLFWWILISILLVMAIPLRLSTLAPAEVTASKPRIVTAPLDGVVQDIPIAPNTMVKTGEEIVKFDDTSLRNNLVIAERALAVAEAAYQQASQGAFADKRDKAKLAILKAEYDLRLSERDYAVELLEKAAIAAADSGLLLFTDRADWIGKPVTVGERIMEIADPDRVELKIFLPVEDAILFDDEIPISIFLDHQPLESVEAKITSANYHAEQTPSGVLAFRITASFTGGTTQFRIGQQGTAKLYGKQVPLAYFLFRRPLSALRQTFGL
ncbi:MAG: HlyD family efflux transporter periplasmic adaptor subunit [Pseudomonadota bacterium]